MIRKRIRDILKEGKKIETEDFILYFKKRDDLKIGFIASGKIGNPVKRNRVKRLIREFVRENFKKGDFLFLLKKESIGKTKNQIYNTFENIKNEIYNFFD